MDISHVRTVKRSPWLLRASALAATALMLVLSACGAGNSTTTSTNNTPGTVKIGNAGTLQPGVIKWGEDSTGGMPYIAAKDANNPSADYYGFEVDIASAMAKLMSVTQQPTQITWSNWPQGLEAQQFDFFMNGLEISSDNTSSAMFSIPYYVYTQSIVTLASNTSITSFADLAGKTVETGTGYQAETVMDDYNASNPTNKIKIVTTDNPTPFNDLLSGRVDAEFLDTPIAAWYGGNDPSGKFKIVGQPLDPGYYGIAFSRNNPNAKTLMAEVNQAIEQLYKNGTLQKIYESGGAYNAGPSGAAVLEKYGMWGSAEACIGNFFPDNPTNVSGCPTLPDGYNK